MWLVVNGLPGGIVSGPIPVIWIVGAHVHKGVIERVIGHHFHPRVVKQLDGAAEGITRSQFRVVGKFRLRGEERHVRVRGITERIAVQAAGNGQRFLRVIVEGGIKGGA